MLTKFLSFRKGEQGNGEGGGWDLMQFLHERYTFYAFGHVTAGGIYDLPSASVLINIFNLLTRLTYRGLRCLTIAFGESGPCLAEAYAKADHPISPSTLLRAERFTPPDKLGIFDMPGIVPANQSYILLTISTHHAMFIA